MPKPKSDPAKPKKAERSLQEDPVFQGILRAITQKRIRPGTKLGEDLMAEIFGTNRTHIRQVLAHLAYRHVVTLLPNRGAFITRPNVDEARAVFRARRAIESATLRDLMGKLTPAAIEALRSHGRTEARVSADDRWRSLTVSGDFHMLIAELAGNEVLGKFLEELILRTSLIIAEYEMPGVPDCAADAHLRILDAIVSGDADHAVALMDQHLVEIEARLRLDEPDAGEPDIRQIFRDLVQSDAEANR